MDKSLYMAVALQNSVSLACFTALAIVFGHWWISLISILFMGSVKDEV